MSANARLTSQRGHRAAHSHSHKHLRPQPTHHTRVAIHATSQSPPLPLLCSLARITQKPVFHTDTNTRFISLLNPEEHGLPLAASLEIVSSSSTASTTHNDRPTRNVDQRSILELAYVLSGSGHLVCNAESDTNGAPRTWHLSAGSSALSWAHSTHLVASSSSSQQHQHSQQQHQPQQQPLNQQQQPQQQDFREDEDQLAVLKFHLPVALLDPLSMSYGNTEDACAVLAQRERQGHTPWHGQGHATGRTLDAQEVTRVLSNAHKRARRAFGPPGQGSLSTDAAPSSVQQQQQPSSSPTNHDSSTASVQPQMSIPSTSPHSSSSTALSANAQTSSSSSINSNSSPPTSAGCYPLSLPLLASSTATPGPSHNSGSSSSVPIIYTQGPVSSRDKSSSSDSSRNESIHESSSRRNDSSRDESSSKNNSSEEESRASSSYPPNPPPLVPLYSASAEGRSASESVLIKKQMEEFHAFQFPNQRNQLALAFDPSLLGLSLSFGVEVFTPGHKTPLHIHNIGHELFFVLSGNGDAWCDGHYLPVQAGDCIVFPPGTLHGLDNRSPTDKMYTLQMMVPDDAFLSFVQSGQSLGSLDDEDICQLTATRCGGAEGEGERSLSRGRG